MDVAHFFLVISFLFSLFLVLSLPAEGVFYSKGKIVAGHSYGTWQEGYLSFNVLSFKEQECKIFYQFKNPSNNMSYSGSVKIYVRPGITPVRLNVTLYNRTNMVSYYVKCD